MRFALLIAMAVFATGCVSSPVNKQVTSAANAHAQAADRYISEMREGRDTTTEPSSVRVIDDELYMPIKQAKVDGSAQTPIGCEIDYNPVSPASLQEIGQAISKACKVTVRITPDAVAAVRRLSGGQGSTVSDPNALVPVGPPGGPAANLPELPNIGTMFGGSAPADQITIAWSGPIGGLLDAVTARLGLSWRHRDGVVSVFYLVTRFYRIKAIPSTSKMESQVLSGALTTNGATGEGANAMSGLSGSNQSTNVELKTDFMKDLEDSVKSMLTPSVGRMALSRSSGSLTVTDTQETLDRVEMYVDQLNTFATKQVLLNVRVLSVSLSKKDEYGIDWNAVYAKVGKYGLNLKNAVQSSMSAVTGSVNILEGNSRFSGSELLVHALSEEGDVSVITQPSVTTLNLEPVPVQVARQVSYLERVELGQTAQVGSTTSLQPGSVTTGFNMMLLPHILDDSQTVLLQYSMNLSSLDNLRTVTSGGSTIEIPEIDNRIFNQKVRLKTNETLILSGFEQTVNDGKRQGVGNAKFWGLGGGSKGDHRKDVIVVLITPIIQS